MRRRAVIVSACLFAACTSNAKEDFLADIDAHGTDAAAEVTSPSDGSTSSDDADASAADSSLTDAQSTTEVVDSVTPTELPSGSDATIPSDALDGFGWLVRLSGLPIARPAVFEVAGGQAIAVPTRNNSAVELRSWRDDGSPLWSSTVYVGTNPTLSGVAFCNGNLTMTGGETGDAKAFVARLDPTATALAHVALSADPNTASDIRALSAPSCGGPGVYAVLNGRSLIDLSGELAVGTSLPLVSSDKIDIERTATASEAAVKVFYLGQVNAPKQLGDTTLQPGDQLIYARDYDSDIGGTATGTGFFGDNDVMLIAPAADNRFAIIWKADVEGGAEQRVTAFDADGQAIGTAVIALGAPVRDARWVGNELVLAGTFDGVPPFPSTGQFAAGTWLAVMTPGAAMTVKRSTTHVGSWGPLGLERIDLHGDCSGPAWAIMSRQSDGVAVVALGDDGSTCHSATLDDDGNDAALGSAPHVVALGDGEYVFASDAFLRLARLRVGAVGAVP